MRVGMQDSNDPAATDARRRRLLFRASHRGSHEADLLVGGFVAARLAVLTIPEIEELEALMDLPCADLADWLTGRLALPTDAAPMLRTMRAAVEARR